jgi:hypothetical protein
MTDAVHPFDGPSRHPGRREVGPDKLRSFHHPGRVAVYDADVMTGVQEGLDQMRPDEPSSPGNQDPHLEPPVVDVILPVLDERAALPGVLASIPDGYRAVVVDNGSTDGSGELAASLGALVVDEPQRGFGAACFAGLVAAEAELVCFMDCDGSLDGADLPRVAAPILEGRADLVMGRRRAAKGAWPVHARFANQVLGAALRARHHVRVRDIGPMRAARRQELLELGIVDRRFGWPLEMVVRAADQGWRITEVDVPYHPREGRSKVTGTLKGTLRTVRDMAEVLR